MTGRTLAAKLSSSTSGVWLQSTVQTFFANCNWADHPPEVQELKIKFQSSQDPLSLTLSVCQFFAAIDWDGTAIAAAPELEPLAPQFPEVDDLTLDDFSSLF